MKTCPSVISLIMYMLCPFKINVIPGWSRLLRQCGRVNVNA